MFYVNIDAGTPFVTQKRFGAVKEEVFQDIEDAEMRARELSLGMKGREVAVIGSASDHSAVEQSVELRAFQNGIQVERQGPFVKRQS